MASGGHHRAGGGGRGRSRPSVNGLVGRAVKMLPDPPKIRMRFNKGTRANWDPKVNPPRGQKLKPNAEYVERSTGYTYRTDDKGRVTSFSGNLNRGTSRRNRGAQRSAGGRWRRANDRGGHLIADIFGGPGDRINMVALDKTINNSQWKRMENAWGRALDRGDTVEVNGRIRYPDDESLRPSRIEVDTRVNSGRPRTLTFNQ